MISLNYKAQFQKNEKLASIHRELVTTEAFQVAIEMALLQYQAQLKNDYNSAPEAGGLMFQRSIGAQAFIDVLLNLGEHAELPKAKNETGLNYAR